MAQRSIIWKVLYAYATACVLFATRELRAEDSQETKQQLKELKQENRALQEQLKKQAGLIETLAHKVDGLQEITIQRGRELEQLKDNAPAPANPVASTLGKVNISGEGAVA